MKRRTENILSYAAFLLVSAAVVLWAWVSESGRAQGGDWLEEQYAEEGVDYAALISGETEQTDNSYMDQPISYDTQ